MGRKGGASPASRELSAIRALTSRASIAAIDQAMATLRLEIDVNDTPWFPASPAQRGADHAPMRHFQLVLKVADWNRSVKSGGPVRKQNVVEGLSDRPL